MEKIVRIENGIVTVSYNESIEMVHLEWNMPPASDEFREGLNNGLALVKEKKSTKWLGDVRELGAILPEDSEWVNTEWFPAAIAAGIKRMAVVIGDDIFNKMSVEEIMQNVESLDFVSRYFGNPEDAMEWLSE